MIQRYVCNLISLSCFTLFKVILNHQNKSSTIFVFVWKPNRATFILYFFHLVFENSTYHFKFSSIFPENSTYCLENLTYHFEISSHYLKNSTYYLEKFQLVILKIQVYILKSHHTLLIITYRILVF